MNKSKWSGPSMRDLQRAQLGSNVAKLTDEELDEYAAKMVLSDAKGKQAAYDVSANYIMDDSRVANTNKRFLANTIRNTSSYNSALLKMEQQQKLTAQSVPIVKKKVKKVKRIVDYSSTVIAKLEHDSEAVESFKHLGALVNHAKLKTKRRKVPQSLAELMGDLGGSLEEGAFGPIPGLSREPAKLDSKMENGLPNETLPEKCPW